ncbi:hypothetical protein PV721_15280 [Streptomyces sp. MB09-01]|uniref:hypothetical protein n=1 Tax=Streptomyces sp. MB09-01 TaxID=3028666 RepID=UPI0029BE79E5|nr:hypothetical protein [Streptomyces sp. MB09-01]MDX3535698.1 hypothetical protein [Streptomyces sp. MB09-01]
MTRWNQPGPAATSTSGRASTTTDIGTNHHYYSSSSFGFRYDGALFDGRLAGGPTDGASAPG